MINTLLIARKEFSDRLRSGWVLACVVVWLGAIGLTSFYGLIQVGRLGVQGYERTVISLLNLVQYLVPLLGLLIGHDLVVKEREDRTLSLVLSSGVTELQLVTGKFIGGCMTIAFPLVLGFVLAGTGIGLATRDNAYGPFLRLAFSGLGLGIIFVGLGLAISTLSRSRLQSLVLALMTWCVAVYVFDLVALGIVVSTQATAAAEEIETVCDPNHLNTMADIHSSYDQATETKTVAKPGPRSASLAWVLSNPVDLFRVFTLPTETGAPTQTGTALLISFAWLAATLGTSFCTLRKLDL